LPSGYSSLQLPSKLIDAMVAGRAVVASDFPPIRWALGETSALVVAGDSHALADACRQLRDPRRREQVGEAHRRRAQENFTPQAVAPRFAEVARAVVKPFVP
jgi:glycosyltransferase involved in cell wall biosynthesis